MYKGKNYCFGSAEAQTNFMKPMQTWAESFYKSEHKG